MFTGRVIEAFDGKDENGSNIKGYSPQNSDIDNFFAKSKYVGEVLIPRFIKEGADYTWGEKAIKLIFTASNISSIDISRIMIFLRLRKIPTTLIVNKIAPRIR